LIEQFGVSRPTLREAYRVLESEGLITVRRGTQGGARVHVPTVEMAAKYAGLVLQSGGATLDEVLQARTLIEPPLAAAIAERSDRKRSAATLRKYIKEHTLTPDDQQYTAEFHGFNRLLMSLTGNDAVVLVTSMLEAIADIAALQLRQNVDATSAHSFELHERATKARLKLADLIAAGDGAGSERLWRAHLSQAATEIAAVGGAQVIDVVG
jgi:DNA-binding FadR family transcriptional regulator